MNNFGLEFYGLGWAFNALIISSKTCSASEMFWLWSRMRALYSLTDASGASNSPLSLWEAIASAN